MKKIICSAALLWAMAVSAQAELTVLHAFTGTSSDGAQPRGSLTLSGSTLYGMTGSGGSNNQGVVFQISTSGTNFNLLHWFIGGSSDGSEPYGSLTLSGATLYGMTYGGGPQGDGTLFQISTNGTNFNLLYSFTVFNTNGVNPQGSLTLSGSTLYGMTSFRGTANNQGFGTIVAVSTNGSGFNLLHTFTGIGIDGATPNGDLTLSGATLYGMTNSGGSNGEGNVFAIGTGGTGYTNLYSFTGGNDGALPNGSLTLSGATLYGMVYGGGVSNKGTVFQISTNGSGFNLLHTFTGTGSDGALPNGSLTLSADGTMLYGMTGVGGVSNKGTVFQISTNGSGFTTLYSFKGGSDGAYPGGSLTLSADGATLYGMTSGGGVSNKGTVFALTASTAIVSVAVSPLSGGFVTGGGSYPSGTNIQLTASASNGWAFSNWSDGSTNNPYSITVPDTNITYTANFLQTTLVTVAASTNIGGSVTGGGVYFAGSNAVLMAAASNHWLFIRWNDGSTNNPYNITVPTTNITYTAIFAQLVTITVGDNTNVGGSVTGSGSFLVGSTNWITASPSNGWVFLGWSDDGTNSPRAIVVGAGGATYTADFAPTVMITANVNTNAAGTATGGGAYVVGSNAVLTAMASNGWQFVNWDDGSTNNPYTVTAPSTNITYTANFTALVTATITVDPSTSVGGTVTGGGTFLISDSVPLAAQAKLGWRFLDWSDGSTNSARSYLVVSNITLTANFTNVPYFYLHDSLGNVTRWAVNNQDVLEQYDIVGSLGNWSLQAMGDINGDGQPDLFWQNNGWAIVWLSQPDGSFQGESLGNLGSWVLRAVADVDGDGVPDLLWQNDTGDVVVWYMNSNATLRAGAALAQPGPLWQLQAAADINGDGKADLFWQNDGAVVVWLSQTNSTYQGLGLGNMGTWELRTAGDVNGDGIPDLVWQNPAGWTAVWYMTTNCTQSGSAGLGNTGAAKIIAVE